MSRLVTAFGVVAALLVAVADVPEGIDSWQPWTLLAGVVAVAPLVRRDRARPLGLLVALAALVAVAVGAAIAGEAGQVPFGHVLVVGVLVADVARRSQRRDVVVSLTAAAAVAVLVEGFADGRSWSDVALVLAVWGLAAATGLAVRFWRQTVHDRTERTRIAERERIARELHDVVAHHVSAIAMTAEGARAVIVSNPDQADRSLVAIHGAATTTLDEMRRMVAILRDDDATPEVPQRLADLADLADVFADSVDDAHSGVKAASGSTGGVSGSTGRGVASVTVTIEDVDREPSAAVRAALFRIAQEAITNARRHARGATRIDVRVVGSGVGDAAHVVLNVRDDGQPSGRRTDDGGFGLRGMRERVELLDGEFRAGPSPNGGWEVHADLPLESRR